MGFLDLFKKKGQPEEDGIEEDNLPEIKESDFVDNSEPLSEEENSTYLVEFGTKLPIDIIYGFLKTDYEKKGYYDALINFDKSYKEANLAIIRSNLEVKFKQVMLKYEDMLRDNNFHIKSRGDAGLITMVDLLKSKKETYENHLETLKQMKKDLISGEAYMTSIFQSYEAGFSRGLASLSLQNLKLKHYE